MGGGAMRTVGKAAALAGYRSTAARRAANVPPAAGASIVHVAIEGESSPLISSVSSEKPVGHPAMAQWPAWDIDDWEFAGGKEEETAAAMAVSDRMLDQPPRQVFGPAPTLEEATEATADLKEAIERAYFSSAIVKDPIKVSQASDLGETAAILPSVPKHVANAFSLLQRSPEAQSVVASLARDKNVWDAVMKNDKVLEFCNKNQLVLPPPESEFAPKESVGGNENLEGSVETRESTNQETSEGSSFYTEVVQNIKVKVQDIKMKVKVKVQNTKVKVSEMVSNISGILQDFLGASSETDGATSTKTGAGSSDKYSEVAMGSALIALAVAVILVVLVKRGSS